MKGKQFFVSGIGTEIGKTVVSAILVEALKADYWKPVQSGDLAYSDTDKVRELVTYSGGVFHPETYRLNTPASPHYAAELDGLSIDLQAFKLPDTEQPLIVEGAGGLHVPLNDEHLIIDLIAYLEIPLILVSRNYLGSINHTLLSIEALQQRDIPIEGIVFNGNPQPSTENYIENYTKIPVLGRVGEERVDTAMVAKYAHQFRAYFEGQP